MSRPRKVEDQIRDAVNQAMKEARYKLAEYLIKVLEAEKQEPDKKEGE